MSITAAMFYFGFGYVASRFHELYGSENGQNNQGQIIGTTSLGAKNTVAFENVSAVQKGCDDASTVLISIPPDSKGCPVFLTYGDHLKHKHIIYLSATNVYGDHEGAWVTEQSECRPETESGKNRLLAEKQWRQFAKKHPESRVTILRLAGIYGPGRSIFERLDSIKERIDYPGHVFSRIFVDDICQVIRSAVHLKGLDADRVTLFNVADDFPAASRDLIEYACDKLSKPYPPLVPLEQANLSPMGKGFYKGSKKVSNQSMKKDLGIELQFPTYKDGLDYLYEDSIKHSINQTGK